MTKDEITALKQRYNACAEEGSTMWERLEVLAEEMKDIRRRLDAEAPGSYDPIELLFSGRMGDEMGEDE
ncbi:hypothetical protein [Caldimonas taiwanensis]|jgi:hypothetical protein|uniref:hypothetical protein n=1 Tax=Caldimonas taiwanensis TaxID=307483 RepID=UPI00078318F1|nr:hypothetical protein [Caldimonas taiwanensis]